MNGIRLLPLLVGLMALAGCRGQPSRQPPVHLNPNMDLQAKYKAFGESDFFDDGKTMRTPPAGTVARGLLNEDDAYYRGKNPAGEWVTDFPLDVDMALVQRGQQRYNIFCSPCHDYAGTGKGPVTMKKPGLVPLPSYHDERVRKLPVGELFAAITDGVRTMPSYAHQIPVRDRWAIVAYIRALQRSQQGE